MKNTIFNLYLLFFVIKSYESFSCNYGDVKYSKFSPEISGYTCTVFEKDTTSQILGKHLTSRSNLNVKVLLKDSEINLYEFSSAFCQAFNNLEVIDISEEQIESINANSLENCAELKQLSFAYNEIDNISPRLFSKNNKLTHISLSNNKLTTLPEIVFSSQHDLDTLDLSYNYIKKLPRNIFSYLSNLKHLNLLNNKLKDLNSNLFENLQSLKTLTLSFNKLSELPKNIFKPLINIEKLWISSNQLAVIHSSSFGNNVKLTLLDMSDNQISSIDPNILDKIKSIGFINMRENVCSQATIDEKTRIAGKLKSCFDLYTPEPKSTFSQNSLPKSCGKPSTGRENIIGGIQLPPGVIRWNAALLTTGEKFFCSGTLITAKRIVTAAHCILQKRQTKPLLARDLVVLLGAYDLSKKVENGRLNPVVSNIIIHPDWNPNVERFDADIAVLILSYEVQFTAHIQPACLIDPDSDVASMTEAYATGYGKSEDPKKKHETIPKAVFSPIQDNEDCFLKFKDLTELSSKRTICAGNANGEGVCSGDSGGGLFVVHENTFYLRGIVSSSLYDFNKVCDVNTYAVFTDVLKFSEWILSVDS